MSRVSCGGDAFYVKCLISKRKKKERRVFFLVLDLHYNEFFIFFFMIHEAIWYIRYQSYRQRKDDTTEKKSKLYLRIILLINYMMEKNLFVYVE